MSGEPNIYCPGGANTAVIHATKADLKRGWVQLPQQELEPAIESRIAALARELSVERRAARAAITLATESFPRLRLVFVRHPSRACYRAVVITSATWHAVHGLTLIAPSGHRYRLLPMEPWSPDRFVFSEMNSIFVRHARKHHIGPAWTACLFEWSRCLPTLFGGSKSQPLQQFSMRLARELTEPLAYSYVERQQHLMAEISKAFASEELTLSLPMPTARSIRKHQYAAQAKLAYPRTLASIRQSGTSDIKAKVAGAIKQGRPLESTLSQLLSVPSWAIRRLESIELSYDRPLHWGGLNALRDLARLSPEVAPRDENEFLSFQDLFRHDSLDFGGALRRLGKTDLRLLGCYLRSKERQTSLRDYVSFVSDVAEWAFPRSPPLLDYRLGEPTFSEWSELSRNWHRIQFSNLGRASPAGASLVATAPWPPLFPTSLVLNGWTYTSLNTAAALQCEGDEMQHCVASYIGSCVRGESFILSARDGSERMTVELTCESLTDDQFEIAQATGIRNQSISRRARGAIEGLLRALNTGEVVLSPEVRNPDRWRRATKNARALIEMTELHWGQSSQFFVEIATDEASLERFRPALEVSPGRGNLFEGVRRKAAKTLWQAPLLGPT